ncbi:MAG: IS200/IS605 family transposase [Saprospiraceae bacterium]
MANTYTQLYIQFVFAVKYRQALIGESIRIEVEKYITGITQNKGHKMLALYCMPDHTHIFVGLNPNQSISSLAGDIKSNSSRWINKEKMCMYEFNWQEGFGAFSYHKSRLATIGNYIYNQPEHHKKQSFKDEYLGLLKEFEVEYNQVYLFDFFDPQ